MGSSDHEPAAPSIKLYDLRAIEIATVFASVIGGAFLLSRNFKALGQNDKARNSMIIGVLGMVAVCLLAFSIVVPETARGGFELIFQAAQVFVVYLVASRVNGTAIREHRSTDGKFYSRWRAAGISLLLLPIPLVAFVGVFAAFPNLPALRATYDDAGPKSTVGIDRYDDKSIVVQGWNASELRSISTTFTHVYRDRLAPSFHPAITQIGENKYRMTFPEGINPLIFSFFVNYIQYPVGFDLTHRSIAAAGFGTTKDGFPVPERAPDEKIIVYVPDNDHDHDVVYIRVGDRTYAESFRDIPVTLVNDPRESGAVAALE